MKNQPLITEIQRFSVNDGPGIRTLVFLKGCPMQCSWCHNPETQKPEPEVYWKKRLCVQCGACLEACPNDAINPPISLKLAQEEGCAYQKIIRDRCDRCLKCVEACRYDALVVVGKRMSIDDILTEVEKDRPFYDNSGGGLTLSGGEPTMHADFSEALLAAAKQRSLHTCLDTNGFCSFETLKKVAAYADIVLFDLKHIDSVLHERETGVKNEIILENLSRLSETGAEIWVRIPVVPGFNDSMGFHQAAAGFLAGLSGGISRVDLLPFHNWCQDKYGWLGIDWKFTETEAFEPALLEILAEIYRKEGLPTTIGGAGVGGGGGLGGLELNRYKGFFLRFKPL